MVRDWEEALKGPGRYEIAAMGPVEWARRKAQREKDQRQLIEGYSGIPISLPCLPAEKSWAAARSGGWNWGSRACHRPFSWHETAPFASVIYCNGACYTGSLSIRRIQDNIVIVGLPDAAVKESRDRVMTALISSGFNFTFGRTTINLAPADVKKEGPSFDLPIAIGMVAASEQTETDQLENFMVVGELALDGGVRPVKGVLPIALRTRAEGKVGVLVPPENAAEAAVVAGLQVIPIHNLREATSFLEGQTTVTPTTVDIAAIFQRKDEEEMDFAEVKGQESVKRAMENRRRRRP